LALRLGLEEVKGSLALPVTTFGQSEPEQQ
jgi:hypothetical protein